MRGLFAALVIVFLIILGVGFYLDWFSFTLNRNPEGNVSGGTFHVNRERIAKDTARAGQAVSNVGKKIQQEARNSTAATHTVQGTLMNVDEAERQLTLKTADKGSVTVRLQPDTKIRRNDVEVNMGGLMPGDRLEVTYRDEQGKHMAESVTVLPGV
jgi:hypothetical protein